MVTVSRACSSTTMAYVANFICFLILIGFNGFLLSESSCYTDIIKQQHSSNGNIRVAGGYQKIFNLSSDIHVIEILELAVSKINSAELQTGRHWQLNCTKDGRVQNVTAYRQVYLRY